MSPTYSICSSHGYLAGGEESCPRCGAETEIYSRITGYYRPVKNWNDGKSQEFRERKVYEVTKSRSFEPTVVVKQEEETVTGWQEDGTHFLFTTKTCPNCDIAKASLEQANISYKTVDAEENKALVRQYGVMQAPTLVVVNGENVQKVSNASNIREYLGK